MARTPLAATEEQRGSVPPCTGARLKCVEIERTKTREKQHRMYVIILSIVEPKALKGMQIRDFCVIGTEDDPLAKKPETWQRSEGGPGRIKRFLIRSGTGIADDDDTWMEAAVGNEVVAPITERMDPNGQMRTNVGLYYRVGEDDAPEIGIAEAGAPKGKGAAGAAKAARRKAVAEPDEDEDAGEKDEDAAPKKGAAKDDDGEADEEDDAPPKAAAKGKAKAKPKAADEDDDED